MWNEVSFPGRSHLRYTAWFICPKFLESLWQSRGKYHFKITLALKMNWEANPTKGFKFRSPVTLYGCSRILLYDSPTPLLNSLYPLALRLKSDSTSAILTPSELLTFGESPKFQLCLLNLRSCFFLKKQQQLCLGYLANSGSCFKTQNCFYLFESYFFNCISFQNLQSPLYTPLMSFTNVYVLSHNSLNNNWKKLSPEVH